MTKFSEIPEPNRSALKEFYFHILNIRAQADKELAMMGLRILFLANVAGLAVMITFLSTLIQTGKSYSTFVLCIKLFLVGAICASLIQLILMAVSSSGMQHVGQQLEQFLKGNLEMEKIEPYGLNRRGKFTVWALMLIGLLLFVVAVWQAFSGLASL